MIAACLWNISTYKLEAENSELTTLEVQIVRVLFSHGDHKLSVLGCDSL